MRSTSLILLAASLASGFVLPTLQPMPYARHLRHLQPAAMADDRSAASKQAAASPAAKDAETHSDGPHVFKTDEPSEDPTVTCWLDTSAAEAKEAYICTDELMDAEHTFEDGKQHGDDSY
jgi:hypothetical protein